MRAVDVQDDRYLTLAEVCDIVKRGKTWIYARVARGEFPRPDEGRWFYSEVMAYLSSRKAGRMAGSDGDGEKKAA